LSDTVMSAELFRLFQIAIAEFWSCETSIVLCRMTPCLAHLDDRLVWVGPDDRGVVWR
jgi:hypothetical protein